MISKEEQDFIYDLYLKWVMKVKATYKEKDYKMLKKLHLIGLIRKLKMLNTSEQQIELSEEGKILGSIICKEKGNFKYVKGYGFYFYW